MTRRRAHRGFTLLEVMVSVGIISLVGTLIYGAFMGMNRSRTNMLHIGDRYQQGRQAIDRMSREISAAFMSAHVNYLQPTQVTRQTAFIGSDNATSDRVDFTAFAHVRLRRDAHESDQCELSYFAASDRATGNLDLVRRISTHIDADVTRGGTVQVLAENIDSFDIKYLDPATNEWVDSWDSTQPAAQLGRLPAQVWITLWLRDGPLGEPIKFETKATLAIQAPINFAN